MKKLTTALGDGTLTISALAEGIYRVVLRRCRIQRESMLTRYGIVRADLGDVDAREENGALTLHRKLTRAALAAFPAEIEFAAESGRKTAAPEQKPENGQTPEKRPETAPAQAAPVPLAPKQSAAPKPRERTGDVLWRDAGDGSLFTVYKNQPYRAIPMAAWGLPTERMVEKRTIEGVEYAIFALKDGRIL